jgi:hypothetical protein
MGFFSSQEIFRGKKENVKPTKLTPKKENKGYKMHT